MDLSGVQGLLSHLSSDEYKEILNDEDKFESLFRDIKQIKDWEAEKDMIIASNRSLAEFNLSRESELLEAKQKVLEKSATGEELCESVQQKLNKYKSLSSGISLDTTLALLEAAAAESEEESEAIAQNFLDGEIDIEKFVEEFSKKRIIMHLRKVKVEKMSDLMKNKSNSQPALFGNPHALPYPSYPAPSFPGYGCPANPVNPMPYPMRPMNMPMPAMYGGLFNNM